jgi:hypothetical protein
LERIEESAFENTHLKSILIPSSVQRLAKSCFSRCESLNSVEFANQSNLRVIEEDVFSYIALRVINVPHTIEVLEKSWFSDSYEVTITQLQITNSIEPSE